VCPFSPHASSLRHYHALAHPHSPTLASRAVHCIASNHLMRAPQASQQRTVPLCTSRVGRVSACTPLPCAAVASTLLPQAGCPPRTTTPGTRPPPPPTPPPGPRMPSLALVPCTALQRHRTPHLATPTPPLRPLLLPLLHTRTHTPTRLLRVAGTSLQQYLRQHLRPRQHPHRMSCRPMLCMGEGTRAGVVEGARAPRLTSRAGRVSTTT
jgi:hypothetical protein